MIDEDKLKSKIEGLKSNLIHGACSSQIAMETCCKEEAYNEVLTVLDSMQEESVSEDTMTIRKEWFEHCKESWYNEGYIDGKYNRDRQFEEPVSEDLEEASKEWLRPQLDKSYANYGEAKMMELTHFDGYAILDAIEFGANWQKEQFEKNRLKHCDSITNEQAELEQGFIDQHLDKHQRMPTYLDAVEYGMRLKEEQMMKGAVDGLVYAQLTTSGEIMIRSNYFKSETLDYLDNVKLIIIKEDKV